MFDNDPQRASLRRLYHKTLWTYIGVSALAIAAAFFLMYDSMSSDTSPLPWLITAGVSLVLSVIEYSLERTLQKKGKNADLWALGFFLGMLLLFVILANAGFFGGYTYLFYPLALGFFASRPLLPAIGLLRDARRLKDGDPCETVGRMKSGARRISTSVGRGSYLLFEDELTHEVRLLLAGSMDPARRYRVLYLPHSGLAVGEVVPDNLEFDPFGNPVERDTAEYAEPHIPAYTEDAYADKPSYTESAEPDVPTYDTPTAEELDPNSPARQKAAKYALAGKLCKGLAYVGFGLTFIGAIVWEDSRGAVLAFPALLCIFGGFLLGDHFKKKDRKLRCTRRTSARCVDTVRRKSGKHSSTLHPIVGFEVNGVSYTAELSVSCSHSSVGELYVIYYDPLDPASVRAE